MKYVILPFKNIEPLVLGHREYQMLRVLVGVSPDELIQGYLDWKDLGNTADRWAFLQQWVTYYAQALMDLDARDILSIMEGMERCLQVIDNQYTTIFQTKHPDQRWVFQAWHHQDIILKVETDDEAA